MGEFSGWNCLRIWVIVALILVLPGCAGDNENGDHVKEITEELQLKELEEYLAIVDRLPGQKLPPFDSPLTPPTRWAVGQEKSIERLTTERLELIEECWTADHLLPYFSRNPKLRWAVASAEMSMEEFAGLTLTIGAALAKSSLPADSDPPAILKRSREAVKKLKEDIRSLAILPTDEQYQISQQSLWISLLDLMTKFPMIPDVNLNLVNQHRARLEKVFPPEFSENLLTHYEKILNSSGLPFEDLPESGITDLTQWNPENAVAKTMKEMIENDDRRAIDEAFTPPEHLFGTGDQATENAEKPAEKDSAMALPEGTRM